MDICHSHRPYVHNCSLTRSTDRSFERLTLSDDEIEGFLERALTSIGMSTFPDVPRRCTDRSVYVIITKNAVIFKRRKRGIDEPCLKIILSLII
jgi:putative transposon-encoded protein